jgi:hypothetical protein
VNDAVTAEAAALFAVAEITTVPAENGAKVVYVALPPERIGDATGSVPSAMFDVGAAVKSA